MHQNKEVLDLLKAKEKEIFDVWLDKKGIAITVEPVKLVDAQNQLLQLDNDPFNTTSVKNISIEQETIITNDYGASYPSKVIIDSGGIEPIDFSLEMMVTETIGVEELDNNFNNVRAHIGGVLVPKGSIITFTDYPNIKLFVRQIQKRRPISDIFIYTLSRT